MSLPRWLARYFPRHAPSRGRKAGARRPSRRLALLVLEDRLAPAVLTVNSFTDPSGPTGLTLSEAVALVNSGGTATDSSGVSLAASRAAQIDTTNPFGVQDTIKFDLRQAGSVPQVISLDGSELLLSRSVNILGPGAGQLAISGGNLSRVLEIAPSADVTVSGLTITQGAVVQPGGLGGGIHNMGTLTLADSVVSGNAAETGGGIESSGTLTLTDSAVSGNSALANDGGIDNFGTLALADSVVSGNTAAVGNGGLANYGGNLTLTDSIVSGNSALGAGGIGNYGGTVALVNTIVSGNRAVTDGGIYNGAAMTVVNSTVSGNIATAGGGVVNSGTLAVSGSTISANTGALWDGGLGNYGTLVLRDSTVSGNSSAVSADVANFGTLTRLGAVNTGVDDVSGGAQSTSQPSPAATVTAGDSASQSSPTATAGSSLRDNGALLTNILGARAGTASAPLASSPAQGVPATGLSAAAPLPGQATDALPAAEHTEDAGLAADEATLPPPTAPGEASEPARTETAPVSSPAQAGDEAPAAVSHGRQAVLREALRPSSLSEEARSRAQATAVWDTYLTDLERADSAAEVGVSGLGASSVSLEGLKDGLSRLLDAGDWSRFLALSLAVGLVEVRARQSPRRDPARDERRLSPERP